VGGRYTEGKTYWAYGTVSWSDADQKIYVTAGSRFSVHDPATGETTRIANGLQWSTVDSAGNVYLSSAANLFRYNVTRSGDNLTCTETLTDRVNGSRVVVDGEVLCLEGAVVNGALSVQPGGALLVGAGTSIHGGFTAADATSVQVRDSQIRGAVSVTGTTGDFVFAGSDLHGSIACSGNASAPNDEGAPNTITGAATGQCAALSQ